MLVEVLFALDDFDKKQGELDKLVGELVKAGMSVKFAKVLGNLYLNRECPKQAYQLYQTFIPNNRTDLDLLIAAGRTALYFKSLNRASEYIQMAKNVDADDPRVKLIAIEYQVETEFKPELLAQLEELSEELEKDPAFGFIYARMEALKDEKEKAIARLTKLLEKHETFFFAKEQLKKLSAA